MQRRITAVLIGAFVLALAGGSSALAKIHLHGYYTVRPVRASPGKLAAESAAGTTIPLFSWHTLATRDGNNYNFTEVGRNPFTKQANADATVPQDIIPIIITIGSTTFDPTVSNATCGEPSSPATLTQQSPLFNLHSYTVGGTNLGNLNYIDMWDRSQYAKYTIDPGAINPTYHLHLPATLQAAVTVTVPARNGTILSTSGCAPLGGMDINWWDPFVQGTLLPELQTLGETSSTHHAILLLSNVVMYQSVTSNCCILGYHSGVSLSSAEQYYSTADFDATGLFGGTSDVSALAHEVGEWVDDPNGTNATPSWGHLGQVSGCQSNLEVGDPLSGTTYSVKMPNGFTYHPQELTYWSWFFAKYASQSIGLHGWFSSNGTFKRPMQGICS